LYVEGLPKFSFSLNTYPGDQVRKEEMDGACSTYRAGSTFRVLVRKPPGKRPFGRLKRRWGDNINVDLK
jgi:hypothetical protein